MSLRPPYILRRKQEGEASPPDLPPEVLRRSHTNPYYDLVPASPSPAAPQVHFQAGQVHECCSTEMGYPPQHHSQLRPLPAAKLATSPHASPPPPLSTSGRGDAASATPKSLQAYLRAKAEHNTQRSQATNSSYALAAPEPLYSSMLPAGVPVEAGSNTRASPEMFLHSQRQQSRPIELPVDQELYTKEVLASVDRLIAAHRDECLAAIATHKQVAEEAQRLLHHLQQAVAMSGVDLALVPAAVTASVLSEPVWAAVRASVMQCAREQSDRATEHILSALLALPEDCADVPAAVRSTIRTAMEDYAERLMSHAKASGTVLSPSLATASAPPKVPCDELRCLQDEVRLLLEGAADEDPLRRTLHQRTVAQMHKVLAASRQEVAALRTALAEAQRLQAAAELRFKEATSSASHLSNHSINGTRLSFVEGRSSGYPNTTYTAAPPTLQSTMWAAREVMRGTEQTGPPQRAVPLSHQSRSCDQSGAFSQASYSAEEGIPPLPSEADVWSTTLDLLAKYGGGPDRSYHATR